MKSFALLIVCLVPLGAVAQGESAPNVAPAVLALPEGMRADASIMEFEADGTLRLAHKGVGPMVCLSDDPAHEDFHIACYHRDLEPYMARGRELRGLGKERSEITETREREIIAGVLTMPDHPSALYSISGPDGCFDSMTGTLCEDARQLYVVYIPYATAESTGLSTDATRGVPWLMNPGKPWAHIMMIPPE
jgi:hypothetical protein